jgi:hypothetical protein
MNKNEIHISDAELDALAATAALGDFTVEEVVAAAVWAFAEQDSEFREYFVQRVLYERREATPRPRRRRLKEMLHGLARRFFPALG